VIHIFRHKKIALKKQSDQFSVVIGSFYTMALCIRAGRALLRAAPSTPSSAGASTFSQNLNEAELQVRMYNKEMHKLRKQFSADVQKQKLAESKAQETETERVQLEKVNFIFSLSLSLSLSDL
jgi:aspartate/tyrosine/aromatic aminotransferase